MDSNTDADDLPYLVWYQCRMCTHLFYDETEKMLTHLDKKHGAMIDCDELRSLVYKNGLTMGGLSISPKPMMKSEDEHEAETELISPVLLSEDEDDEDEAVKLRQELDINEMGLPGEEKDGDNGAAEVTMYNLQGGHDEAYEETDYQFTNHIKKYELNDEEQLTEDGVDFENQDVEELEYEEHDDTANHHLKKERYVHNEDEYEQEEEDYDEDGEGDWGNVEEGELSGEHSIYGELDEDGLIYEGEYEELEEDEGEEAGLNGIYSNHNNQNPGILNYGYSCKYCDKFFTTRRGVESHEQHHKNQMSPQVRRSNEPRKFPCKICKDKSFASFKDLKMHVKSHTPEIFIFASFVSRHSTTLQV